jgi:hypothetical protein
MVNGRDVAWMHCGLSAAQDSNCSLLDSKRRNENDQATYQSSVNGKARFLMSAGASAGAAAAAAAAAAQAIKASGTIVRVEPEDFLRILARQNEPLVVHATAGFFSTSYMYLASYKGLAFFTKSAAPLDLPSTCEIVQAQKIWIPG